MITLDGIIYSLQQTGGISGYFDSLIEEIDSRGLPRHVLGYRDGIPFADTTLKTPRMLERYRDVSVPQTTRAFMSSYYRLPRNPQQVPSIVTVHDFVYEAVLSGPKVALHKWQKHRAIREASDIICISEATRQDMLTYFGMPKGKVHVIHNGVSEAFRPLTEPGDHDGYVLFVGKRGRYKNFALLVEAMADLDGFDLVCVGGEPWSDAEKAATQEAIKGQLVIRNGVSTEDLVGLFDRATALVYPSTYEGFGIPILEAMRAGCPAISIDCKAVREAGGNALLVAETNAAGEIANYVREMNGPQRMAVVSAGLAHAANFSWAKCHKQTVDILSKYL